MVVVVVTAAEGMVSKVMMVEGGGRGGGDGGGNGIVCGRGSDGGNVCDFFLFRFMVGVTLGIFRSLWLVNS